MSGQSLHYHIYHIYQISKLSLVKFSKFKMFRRQKGWFECGWIILLNIQTISRENGFKSDIQNVAKASERVVRVWRVLDYPFQRSRHLRCHANKIIAIKMVIIIVNTVIIIVNMVIIMATMARPSPPSH